MAPVDFPPRFLPRYLEVDTNVRTDCDGAVKNVFSRACFELHNVPNEFEFPAIIFDFDLSNFLNGNVTIIPNFVFKEAVRLASASYGTQITIGPTFFKN